MKIGIVGAGNMASSLLLPLKKELAVHEVKIFTPTHVRAAKLAKKLEARAVQSLDELQGMNVGVTGGLQGNRSTQGKTVSVTGNMFAACF